MGLSSAFHLLQTSLNAWSLSHTSLLITLHHMPSLKTSSFICCLRASVDRISHQSHPRLNWGSLVTNFVTSLVSRMPSVDPLVNQRFLGRYLVTWLFHIFFSQDLRSIPRSTKGCSVAKPESSSSQLFFLTRFGQSLGWPNCDLIHFREHFSRLFPLQNSMHVTRTSRHTITSF